MTDKVQGRHNMMLCLYALIACIVQLLSPDAKVISQYHTLIDSLIEFLGCYNEFMLMFVLWKVRDYRALLTGNGRWVNSFHTVR